MYNICIYHIQFGGQKSEATTCDLFFYLGALSSQNPRMDSLGYYVTNSWEYGATLISCHWILCRAPFWGRWENGQNHAEKYYGALIWWVVMTKWLNIGKPENKLALEMIDLHFGIKYAVKILWWVHGG